MRPIFDQGWGEHLVVGIPRRCDVPLPGVALSVFSRSLLSFVYTCCESPLVDLGTSLQTSPDANPTFGIGFLWTAREILSRPLPRTDATPRPASVEKISSAHIADRRVAGTPCAKRLY